MCYGAPKSIRVDNEVELGMSAKDWGVRDLIKVVLRLIGVENCLIRVRVF